MASYTSIIKGMLCPINSAPSTSKAHWEPSQSMPLLADRICIITGPTSGIGYETLRQLILSSAHVYLFGRTRSKLEITRDTILDECITSLSSSSSNDYPQGSIRHNAEVGKMDIIQCDLSDLTSIQCAAQEFLDKEQRLDLFFGNAGVMVSGTTLDGYEMMWGTNVLGHHALLRLLLPALRTSSKHHDSVETGKTRVILTASDTHRWVDKPEHLELSPDAFNRKLGHIHLYGRSKLGNIFTANKLAQWSDENNLGITVCSVHPGGVKSQLGSSNTLLTRIKNWFLVPAPLGAVTQLWSGTGAEAHQVHSKYMVPWARVGVESELANNDKVRDHVWEWCEQQCVKHGLFKEDQLIT
ncbi:uncharacterized protein MEPE_00951 [Melanopsichium pennsylvanicum]|uniref:NAD(P)-binding protein n=2 Tax=Melanopsichium pennsylvanicum TaxID=63383 RepID=A0AAJ5C352_9BASI|nr:nad-binding protein [Melanopsichium pennsylvanicum 4]SNX82245.1 uncharacterized protein MEPE_00951 [Melanopsichium pennsylvanicum]